MQYPEVRLTFESKVEEFNSYGIESIAINEDTPTGGELWKVSFGYFTLLNGTHIGDRKLVLVDFVISSSPPSNVPASEDTSPDSQNCCRIRPSLERYPTSMLMKPISSKPLVHQPDRTLLFDQRTANWEICEFIFLNQQTSRHSLRLYRHLYLKRYGKLAYEGKQH